MNIPAKPWKKDHPPGRILAIRLQAMGDMVITLPYLQHLRNSLPEDTEIDFLTREEVSAIPENIHLFDRVYKIGGGRNFKKQLLHAGLLLPRLAARRYDVVLDLQHNPISRMVRNVLRPAAWTAFDRYSPLPAGERNRNTIAAAGLGPVEAAAHFRLKTDGGAYTLLKEQGWNESSGLVVLNPAGAFENRNWPIASYVAFAMLWLQYDPGIQFLILGTEQIAVKAEVLKAMLGNRLVNLVGKTSPFTAFSVLQQVRFVLSEDSGLMHMAWVSGIPTLAMFGSTRSDWARPLGAHTAFMDAADMVCGGCMQAGCSQPKDRQYYCMTRYTPAIVFEKAMQLMEGVRHAHDHAGY